MFISNDTLKKLLDRIEKQDQEIDKLHEKLAILAQSQGKQFEFIVGEGYKLTAIPGGHEQFIDAKRRASHSPNSLP